MRANYPKYRVNSVFFAIKPIIFITRILLLTMAYNCDMLKFQKNNEK